jgi:hypothetical protein
VTGPTSTPRGEPAGQPGVTWNTVLTRTETVIYDPEDTSGQISNPPLPPRPNRATRRAQQRAARRTK